MKDRDGHFSLGGMCVIGQGPFTQVLQKAAQLNGSGKGMAVFDLGKILSFQVAGNFLEG
ncbi:MAG: hypothetical protein SFV51_31620 [Bryobacteraceae bacterium]|nr:hypothetical protein [Bryobacteraceae bacterium]